MRVGVQLVATCRDDRQPADALRETVQLTITADRLGFDTVWFAEHHGTEWNSCSDPLTLAAHVAAKTSRITLGTAVVNLTLHHPRAIAERTRLVQALSHDRLTLGIGRGFSTSDHQTFDIPTAQAADTFTANHQRLRAELAGVGAPVPPIWLATTGAPPSLRMAAEHRYASSSPATARNSAPPWPTSATNGTGSTTTRHGLPSSAPSTSPTLGIARTPRSRTMSPGTSTR